MRQRPLVTVVIPTWNRLDLLREAIASVVSQTYSNWELIVSDDGSTDGTAAYLSALAEPRIRWVANEHVGKLGRVRNVGAAAGTGEWIAFLDSDDLWMPDKLEVQLDALERSGAGWCYGQCELLGPDGNATPIRSGRFEPISGRIVEDLLADRTGVCSPDTVVVRRELFETLGGFDESLSSRADLDFELRLAVASDAVAVDGVVARIREHEGRKTRASSSPHEETARVFERFRQRHPGSRWARLARAREARLLAEAGAHCVAHREFARSAQLLLRALRLGVNPGLLLRSTAGGVRRSLAGNCR